MQSQEAFEKLQLPRSPRRKLEIVKSMASTFNLRIQLKNIGRPKKALSDDERFWLEQFFQRPDITYITPGNNQQMHLGKVNGESTTTYCRTLMATNSKTAIGL